MKGKKLLTIVLALVLVLVTLFVVPIKADPGVSINLDVSPLSVDPEETVTFSWWIEGVWIEHAVEVDLYIFDPVGSEVKHETYGWDGVGSETNPVEATWNVPSGATGGTYQCRVEIRHGISPGPPWEYEEHTTKSFSVGEVPPTEFDFDLSVPGVIDVDITDLLSGAVSEIEGRFEVEVTLTEGVSQPVALTCTPQNPTPGVDIGFSPASGFPTFTAELVVTVVGEPPMGSHSLTIIASNGVSKSTSCTLYLYARPRITVLSPECAWPGAMVTIEGENLAPGTIYLPEAFGEIPVGYAGSMTSATFRIPAHPAECHTSIKVVIPFGECVSADELLFPCPANADTCSCDLRITGIELTQGIQNLDNDVPLVGGKRTIVRVYIDVGNVAYVPEVHGTLCDDQGRCYLPLNDGVSIPENPDRGNVDHTLNFWIPRPFTSVSSKSIDITLTADVWGTDHYGNPIAEVDSDNNDFTITATFHHTRPLCVVFVKVRVEDSAGNVVYFTVDDPEFPAFIWYMEKVYPVAEVRTYRGGTVSNDWTVPLDWEDVLSELWWHNFWTDDPDECFHVHYYGMVHPNHTGGGPIGMAYWEEDSVWDEAAGVMSTSTGTGLCWEYPEGASTMAHELGHNIMRRHTGCRANEAGPDSNYPYNPCNIGPVGDPTAYYGFDIYNPTDPDAVIEPDEAGPIMSYRNPAWIDDYTYRALFNHFKNPGGYEESQGISIPTQSSECLGASGIVNIPEQTATLEFYRMEESRVLSVSQQEGDIYSLVLEDAIGEILYTHNFTLKTYSGRHLPSSDNGFFGEVLPYDPQTARIVLKHGEIELASRSVSGNVPEVEVIYPNGGEVLADEVTLQWTASDADGDELIYTVRYSPDGGNTWKAVSVNQHETTFELNLDWLPGSSDALIKVIASDGVNTGTDECDAVFTVEDKSPEVYIHKPSDGAVIASGELVIFSGTALDTEDGSIPDYALTWVSGVDGLLGHGSETGTASLSSGHHLITLTATDSDGNVGTASIALEIEKASLSSVADAFISEMSPTESFGTSPSMSSGHDLDTGTFRSFVLFDLSDIPTGSTINSALFNAYVSHVTGSPTMELCRVMESWDEYSVNWENQPSVSPTVYAVEALTYDDADNWKSWDVTALVREWLDESPNYGLGLWGPESGGDWARLHTREGDNLPYLLVDYTAPWVGLGPVPTGVSPDQGGQGETLDVTITGNYFTGASAVSFGAGITVNSFTVDSPNQITADITIAVNATTGSRDVSVTTPEGSGILAGGFMLLEEPSTPLSTWIWAGIALGVILLSFVLYMLWRKRAAVH